MDCALMAKQVRGQMVLVVEWEIKYSGKLTSLMCLLSSINEGWQPARFSAKAGCYLPYGV